MGNYKDIYKNKEFLTKTNFQYIKIKIQKNKIPKRVKILNILLKSIN